MLNPYRVNIQHSRRSIGVEVRLGHLRSDIALGMLGRKTPAYKIEFAVRGKWCACCITFARELMGECAYVFIGGNCVILNAYVGVMSVGAVADIVNGVG